MTAEILDGAALARTLRQELEAEVAAFEGERGWAPGLAVVQMGEDPASLRYVRAIERSFSRMQMRCALHILPLEADAARLQDLLRQLNADPRTNGIIVQIPLPEPLQISDVTAALDPAKDVDGIHPLNAGKLMQGSADALVPATPAGGMEILRRYGVGLVGKRAVMVGRSNIVGRPMALLMLHEHATVTICHSRTADLGAVTREADVLVAAVGRPRMITADMVKPGAVVIDFGVNVIEGRLVGDVDTEAVAQVAGQITPVPGGTGPMTNLMLARNTLTAARRQMRSAA
ncbi:MAG: bifunctional 5,10-methylenetetrahydrofolate dehydrogenase/5,10-methenyltetrahydrofolate cyclohydrolase [Anaerolineae bacterium]|nr:bifunctional 5,10-methylenetetrahydrofolate dehydrogenase/5,10-methenyltetrahydrofolate cyclohydrolase [Anaerolineae bacterium]